jgi:hypothetical protein
MKIILKKTEEGFLAHLENYLTFSGSGKTVTEAIGQLILQNQGVFNLKIRWDKQDEKTKEHLDKVNR